MTYGIEAFFQIIANCIPLFSLYFERYFDKFFAFSIWYRRLVSCMTRRMKGVDFSSAFFVVVVE